METVSGMLTKIFYNENGLENVDETYFVFNLNHRRNLGFSETVDFKFADVVRGGKQFAMTVWITVSCNALFAPEVLIL